MWLTFAPHSAHTTLLLAVASSHQLADVTAGLHHLRLRM